MTLASTLLLPSKIDSDIKIQSIRHIAPAQTQIVKRAEALEQITIAEIKELAKEAGAKYHVNPNLVLAVIKSESDFNPNLIGGKGEIGLMQIIPSNTKYTPEQLKDPRLNIFVGTSILRDDIRQFKSVSIALEAYNAGNSKVLNDNIPKSTRLYVKNTLKHYSNFLRRYSWVVVVLCILHFYPQFITDPHRVSLIKAINWTRMQ